MQLICYTRVLTEVPKDVKTFRVKYRGYTRAHTHTLSAGTDETNWWLLIIAWGQFFFSSSTLEKAKKAKLIWGKGSEAAPFLSASGLSAPAKRTHSLHLDLFISLLSLKVFLLPLSHMFCVLGSEPRRFAPLGLLFSCSGLPVILSWAEVRMFDPRGWSPAAKSRKQIYNLSVEHRACFWLLMIETFWGYGTECLARRTTLIFRIFNLV